VCGCWCCCCCCFPTPNCVVAHQCIHTNAHTHCVTLAHGLARLTNTRCFRQRTVYVYGPNGIHVYGIRGKRATATAIYILTYMYNVYMHTPHALCNCVVMRIYEYVRMNVRMYVFMGGMERVY